MSERDDYAALADEMSYPGATWTESEWDPATVASGKAYAATNGLPWPPAPGDFDRLYEKERGR